MKRVAIWNKTDRKAFRIIDRSLRSDKGYIPPKRVRVVRAGLPEDLAISGRANLPKAQELGDIEYWVLD